MKQILIASVLLASILAGSASYAEDNSDQKASEISGNAALDAISIPVCLCAVATLSGIATAVGTGHQLIKLVDAAGNGLSELTADGLLQIDNALTPDHRVSGEKKVSAYYKATFKKKEIPLLVRPEYVELNEKVKLK
jgi:hypothetical protein